MPLHEFTIGLEKLPMWSEPIYVARLASCEAHLARFGNELNIQMIWSRTPGQGHASELIEGLLRYCKKHGLTLVSSEPISAAWAHLCEKHDIPCYFYGLPAKVSIKELRELDCLTAS